MDDSGVGEGGNISFDSALDESVNSTGNLTCFINFSFWTLNFSRISNIGIENSVYVGDLYSDLFSSQVVFGGCGWFKRID